MKALVESNFDDLDHIWLVGIGNREGLTAWIDIWMNSPCVCVMIIESWCVNCNIGTPWAFGTGGSA